MGSAQLGNFLVQFAASVIIARLLSPLEVGVYAIAVSICGILGIIQSLGLSAFIVREADLPERLKATTFTIGLLLNVAVAAIIGLCSLASSVIVKQASVARVLAVLALMPLLGILEFLPAAMLERAAKFKVIAGVGLARSMLAQGLTVALAVLGCSSMSFAYGQLAGTVFSVVAYNVFGRAEIRLRLRLADWRRVAAFGAQMLTINGANASAGRLAEILLARIAGLQALGLFSRASSINDVVWNNIHAVVARVLLVRLASLQKSGLPLRDYYLQVVELLTAVLWPVFIGLAVVAGPFIATVYGRQWVPAASPLVLLALSSAVWATLTMSWELFVVCGETRRQARIELVRTGVGTCLFATGAAFAGTTGAAAGRLGDSLFSFFIYRQPLERMSATTMSDIYPIYLRSAVLAALAVAPAALLMLNYHGAVTVPFGQLIAAVVLGIAIWAAALMLTNHPLAMQLKRLLPRATETLE
jgi:O-antigen/teichoic acid export membrane protein